MVDLAGCSLSSRAAKKFAKIHADLLSSPSGFVLGAFLLNRFECNRTVVFANPGLTANLPIPRSSCAITVAFLLEKCRVGLFPGHFVLSAITPAFPAMILEWRHCSRSRDCFFRSRSGDYQDQETRQARQNSSIGAHSLLTQRSKAVCSF
jgi:hypothetical protein